MAEIGFPYVAERLKGYIEMHKGWCDSQNQKNTKLFWDKLESWKFDARFAQGQGFSVPPRPTVPVMRTVDEVKATTRFYEWESGLPQTFDFYIEKKLDVPESAFDLAGPAPAPPSDPVFGPDGDIPGQFLVAQGDTHAPGEIIEHPKYGTLVKTRKPTPFGNVDRWRKIG